MYVLQKAVEEFIEHCKFEKKLSPKTIKAYLIDLNQLISFLQQKKYSLGLSAITKIELREYLESISILSPASIKRKIATIKVLFNFLEFEELLIINPLRKMRIRIKEYIKLPVSLNINEIWAIFQSVYNEASCKQTDSNSYLIAVRNIVVVELLFATGARVSEISNLMNEDIDLNTGEITIKGKGGKERIAQVFNKDSLNIIKNYRDIIKKKKGLNKQYFLINRLNRQLSDQSIRNIIKTISKKTKIQKHITPHVFRHSFATLLLEKDVDIKYIQSLLGHSSIMTTQRYTHVNREKQKQILKEKHPRKEFSIII